MAEKEDGSEEPQAGRTAIDADRASGRAALTASSGVKAGGRTTLYIALTAAIFLAAGLYAGGGISGISGLPSVSAQEIGQKCADFIESNLVQPGENVSVLSVEDAGSMYLVKLSYRRQSVDVYASKDGRYLIPGASLVLDMGKPLPRAAGGDDGSAAPGTIPKSDRPLVELFVMSFCPYGVQAEEALAPVVGLLGDKADIRVRFIASVPEGGSLNAVQSLHGTVEGIEDARQLCISKNHDAATYWKYLSAVNQHCYPQYRGAGFDACWKSAAANASIDIAKMEGCMETEGAGLINADEEAAAGYGVTGSPTLVINGARYNGARTAEAFKAAICGAFNTAPAECGQALSSDSGQGAPAAGGCGA